VRQIGFHYTDVLRCTVNKTYSSINYASCSVLATLQLYSL